MKDAPRMAQKRLMHTNISEKTSARPKRSNVPSPVPKFTISVDLHSRYKFRAEYGVKQSILIQEIHLFEHSVRKN